MIPLTEFPDEVLWRGAVFRCKGKYPFEEAVDFMLMCYPNGPSGFAIYCISGYCAGNMEVALPKEALASGVSGISTAWLRDNWTHWVYPDCPAEDVFVFYPPYPNRDIPVE